MSKYFDETVGNNGAGEVRSLQWSSTAPRSKEKASAVRSTVASANQEKVGVSLSETVGGQFTDRDALGVFQESYRVLRTRLLRLRAERTLRSVVITSSTKGEGKSLTVLNLAYSCAQLPDQNVLIIDADIRSCGLSQRLETASGKGLSDVLSRKCAVDEVILATDVPNLHFLPCSFSAMAPAELLASSSWPQLIQLCVETFSLVIVDAPPILNYTDVELIAASCDGVLMVVRSQQTRTDFLERSVRQIDTKKFLGVILNGAEENFEPYGKGHARAPAGNVRRPGVTVADPTPPQGAKKDQDCGSQDSDPSASGQPNSPSSSVREPMTPATHSHSNTAGKS